MKRRVILLLPFFICASFSLIAQFMPQGFSYQTVIRSNNGNPLANQTVNLLFSIRNGSATGGVVYSEKHVTSTNEFGLVNLIIGAGTPLQGNFGTINWGSSSKYLSVSIETTPNVFDELGATQLFSVPYALLAQNTLNGPPNPGDNWGTQIAFTNGTLTGNGLAGSPLGIAQQDATPGQVLKWNGSAWAPANDNSGSSGGGGTVTQINTGAGLIGGPITTSGTIGLSNTGVVPGPYGSATEIPVITVDAQGRITNIVKTIVQPGQVGITGGAGINIANPSFNNFSITNTGDTNAADDVTTSSQADGDVSGTFNNLQIKANAVSSNEIAANAVTTSDIAANAVTAAKLADMGAQNGQVLKWNGTTWAPSVDNSGTINLTGGAGISLSGTAPNITITNSGDTNAADDITTASQSGGDVSGPFNNLQIKADVITAAELANNAVETAHVSNAAITAAKLANMGAQNGQVLKWNGTAWAPAADQGGTFTVVAGVGVDVTVSGNSFIVDNTGDVDPNNDLTTATAFNGDVSGPYNNLQIKADVITTTELDNNAVATANLQDASVTAAKLNKMNANNGQVLKWNGTTWAPADDLIGTGGGGDNWGTQTAQSDQTIDGDGTAGAPLKIAKQNATLGQVLKWNGTTWAPSDDATSTGGGSNNNYAAGVGISITGSAPNFTINNTGDLDNLNEIQVISLAGNTLTLSKNGGSVTIPAGNNYTAGTGIMISGTAPNFQIKNTGDLSNTNEVQTLSLNGSKLSLSLNNSAVDLDTLLSNVSGGGGLWQLDNAVDIRNTNPGKVIIGSGGGQPARLQVFGKQGSSGYFGASDGAGDVPSLISEHLGTGPAGLFSSAGNAALIVDKGNSGFGTSDPAFKIDVLGQGRFKNSDANPQIIAENGSADFARIRLANSGGSWNINAKGGGTGELFFDNSALGGAASKILSMRSNGSVGVGAINNTDTRLRISHGANFGLGLVNTTNNHFWDFWVNNTDGSLTLWNDQLGNLVPAGTFNPFGVYTPSDKRLKSDIEAIGTGILTKIMQLSPVTYRYNSFRSDRRTTGFLAQDVQALFPELVGETTDKSGENRFLSLNYAGFTPIIVKAVQEQQTQIDALKKQNAELKSMLEALEARLKALEK